MFAHIYVNRLKCILKDKQIIFWTLMFPILLGTLFYLAFSNLSSAENFSRIPIAIIDNSEYQNSMLKTTIAYVSTDSGSENKMFEVTLTDEKGAEGLLKDNKIKGYILLKSDIGIKLTIKQSGLDQTLIKSFLDTFSQMNSTFTRIIQSDPKKYSDPSKRTELLKSSGYNSSILLEKSASKSKPDTTVNYFYTLIAMACLYGGFLGLKEIGALQADLSPEGARINVAPVHKMIILLSALAAALTVHFAEILVVLAYLIFVLKINFGDQIGFILLLSFVSCMLGLSFGAFVTSVVKKREGIKIGILTGASMFLSFLAGMMYVDIKYMIIKNAPIVGYLNPANLITDGFYALYFYDDHTRFYINLAGILIFTALFCIGTYLVLRRRRYASL